MDTRNCSTKSMLQMTKAGLKTGGKLLGEGLDIAAIVVPVAVTGQLTYQIKEAARALDESVFKTQLKTGAALISSTVTVGGGLKANIDLSKILFQVWPHLNNWERAGVCLMIFLADAALVYTAERFGKEQNLLAACYAGMAGIAALKLTEKFLLFKASRIEANANRFEEIDEEKRHIAPPSHN